MRMDAHAPLTGWLRAAREARKLVRDVLGKHHPALSDGELVASELVTNAVVHTRSGQSGGSLTLSVGASSQPPAVCISVRDMGSADAPVVVRHGRDGEHGQGLAIVAALADEWGTEPRGQGRVTWCRLAPEPLEPRVADTWCPNLGSDLGERSVPGVELEAEP